MLKRKSDAPLEYERQVVRYHEETTGHKTWHQPLIPEYVYYESGFITEWNKPRLERLMKRRKLGTGPLLPDYGVDHISLDLVTGTYHAGQAKMYERKRVCSSSCATFTDMCHIMGTKGFLYTSKDKLECNFRDNLKALDIQHVVLPAEDQSQDVALGTEESTLPLRGYQKDAVSAVTESESHKTLIRLATGTGKTVVASHIMRTLDFNHIVCVAPLLCSTEQLHTRVAPFLPNHKVILVHSEGVTDPGAVREKTLQHEKWVIFTTFESFNNVLPNVEISFEGTFLLVDEVHNTLNKREMCEYANRFQHSLYLSATVPEELHDVLEFEEVFSYNIRTAISEGVCADYEIYLPFIEAVPEDLVTDHPDLCNKALYLAKGMIQRGKRRCVVYLNSIDESVRFQRVLSQVFEEYQGIDITTYNIHCGISKSERGRILDEFRSGEYDNIKIITNVRILDESIDIVECDSVFITHEGTERSALRTVQRLGRATRKDPRNTSKVAAMFLWCDDLGACASMLQMLKYEDVKFENRLRVMSTSYDHTSERAAVVAERRDELVEFVRIRCLTFDEHWELRRQQWAEYFEINKSYPSQMIRRCTPLTLHKPEERRLGRWQAKMRGLYTREILSQPKIDALNAVVGWRWDGDMFESNLRAWAEHFEINKSYPSQHKPEERRLGKWQHNTRTRYKNGDLSEARVAALNAVLGWRWDCFQSNLRAWAEHFEINKSYPSQHKPEERRLAQWQSDMRKRYRASPKELSQPRIDALNAVVGWRWEHGDGNMFEYNLRAWAEYFEINKSPPKGNSKDPEEKRLAGWQSRMRLGFKGLGRYARLSQPKIDALNAVVGWRWTAFL